MREWYEKHLGLQPEPTFEGTLLHWRDAEEPHRPAVTVWADTKYFDPSRSSLMINYRVEDMDALLAVRREEGVWIDEKREDGENGRFAWIMDPEGNRIELGEPPKDRGQDG